MAKLPEPGCSGLEGDLGERSGREIWEEDLRGAGSGRGIWEGEICEGDLGVGSGREIWEEQDLGGEDLEGAGEEVAHPTGSLGHILITTGRASSGSWDSGIPGVQTLAMPPAQPSRDPRVALELEPLAGATEDPCVPGKEAGRRHLAGVERGEGGTNNLAGNWNDLI